MLCTLEDHLNAVSFLSHCDSFSGGQRYDKFLIVQQLLAENCRLGLPVGFLDLAVAFFNDLAVVHGVCCHEVSEGASGHGFAIGLAFEIPSIRGEALHQSQVRIAQGGEGGEQFGDGLTRDISGFDVFVFIEACHGRAVAPREAQTAVHKDQFGVDDVLEHFADAPLALGIAVVGAMGEAGENVDHTVAALREGQGHVGCAEHVEVAVVVGVGELVQ